MVPVVIIITSSIIYCLTLLYLSLNFIESRFNTTKPTFTLFLFSLLSLQTLKTFCMTSYELSLNFVIVRVILIGQSIVILGLMYYQVSSFALYYENRYKSSYSYYKYLLTCLIVIPSFIAGYGGWYILLFTSSPLILKWSLVGPCIHLCLLSVTILQTTSYISIYYYSLLTSGTMTSRDKLKLYIFSTLLLYVSTLLPLITTISIPTSLALLTFQTLDIYVLLTLVMYRLLFVISTDGRRRRKVVSRGFVIGSEPLSSTESLK
jgi:hypothetical protein